jgi:hypothetical protein
MRRLKARIEAEGAAMAAWSGASKPEKGGKARGPRSASGMRRAIDRAKEMQEANDWQGAGAAELVGLYAVLHEHVYGVAPEEVADVWLAAVSAAKRMLERDFEGSVESMVDFLRWTWRRERNREKKRAANGDGSFRIGWRLQFVARNLMTDYRVDAKRDARASGQEARR